jgi:hypothetical protein
MHGGYAAPLLSISKTPEVPKWLSRSGVVNAAPRISVAMPVPMLEQASLSQDLLGFLPSSSVVKELPERHQYILPLRGDCSC